MNASLGVLFLFGAAVQYNDPDPLRWMLLYLAAAVACLLAAANRSVWQLAAVTGLVALAWAATLAPGVLGDVRIGELVGAWEMKNERVERGREMGGLLIVFAWMAVLAWTGRRRARPAASAASTRP